MRGRRLQCALAGVGQVDLVVASTQVGRQRTQHVRIVVDAQDAAHRSAPIRAESTRAGRHAAARRPRSGRRRACRAARACRPSPMSVRWRWPARDPARDAVVASPSRWNGCRTFARCLGWMPGPSIDDLQQHVVVRAARRGPRTGRSAGDHVIAFDTRLATTRSSSAGIGPHVGQVDRQIQLDVVGSTAQAVQRRRQHLLERHSAQRGTEGARLQPAEVEQVGDDRRQPVGLVLDRLEEVVAHRGRPVDVTLAQARDRCLDAGQRRTQIVRHGAQHRRAQRVGLLERVGLGGDRSQVDAARGRGSTAG